MHAKFDVWNRPKVKSAGVTKFIESVSLKNIMIENICNFIIIRNKSVINIYSSLTCV